MAGLVPAIHDLSRGTKNVDARDKPGHDEFVAGMPTKNIRICDSPAACGKRELRQRGSGKRCTER
jgi:hypothetical protein